MPPIIGITGRPQEVPAAGTKVRAYLTTHTYSDSVRNRIWHEIVDAAERNNKPGEFTALIGWEWTSTPDGLNLHRIIFTPDGKDKAVQYLPFSLNDSEKPRDLWNWLGEYEAKTGGDVLAAQLYVERARKGQDSNADDEDSDDEDHAFLGNLERELAAGGDPVEVEVLLENGGTIVIPKDYFHTAALPHAANESANELADLEKVVVGVSEEGADFAVLPFDRRRKEVRTARAKRFVCTTTGRSCECDCHAADVHGHDDVVAHAHIAAFQDHAVRADRWLGAGVRHARVELRRRRCRHSQRQPHLHIIIKSAMAKGYYFKGL